MWRISKTLVTSQWHGPSQYTRCSWSLSPGPVWAIFYMVVDVQLVHEEKFKYYTHIGSESHTSGVSVNERRSGRHRAGCRSMIPSEMILCWCHCRVMTMIQYILLVTAYISHCWECSMCGRTGVKPQTDRQTCDSILRERRINVHGLKVTLLHW